MGLIFNRFYLESFEKLEVRYVFAKEVDCGWEGWVISKKLTHEEMIEQEPITWIRGLWFIVTEEYVKSLPKVVDTSYRNVR